MILFFIQNLANIFTLLMIMLGCTWLLLRFKKRTAAKIAGILTAIVFLLTSTGFLPRYLATELEKKYLPFNTSMVSNPADTIYIHVLGSGTNQDKRLPANAQLCAAATGRLMEAIRIHQLLKNSIIVCSGNSLTGQETQASTTRRAAIVLGIDSNRVKRLDTPATTQEEATALRTQYGNKIKVIVVSDAMHLPRAIKIFKKEGFEPIAAPTNFRIPQNSDGRVSFGWLPWLPSTENIGLMDRVFHEFLGNIKAGV